MLSPLQRQVAQLVSSLPEADGFALAGGGAILVHRVVDRTTRDLDFFSPSAAAVDRLLPQVERALHVANLTTARVQVGPGFARLEVSDGHQTTRLDLGTDARLTPAVPSELGPVVSERELAVDKVLAVTARAEPRDFIDLNALERRFGLTRICELAKEKDLGFSKAAFLDRLERFDRLPRDEFEVDDRSYELIRVRVAEWSRSLERDLEREQRRELRGPGAGLDGPDL